MTGAQQEISIQSKKRHKTPARPACKVTEICGMFCGWQGDFHCGSMGFLSGFLV